MMKLYGLKELKKDRFERYRKRYSPYGSVASLYLWALAGMQLRRDIESLIITAFLSPALDI
jgi:3-methyladenine DNA glycosylase/8-oxoguanine DNA glycosylase